ncbi:MAG TPA: NYN domain-containing protein [Longimicrobium sp.]|nr:NYN domain-containing protein [Longimicrobium sp.]
MDRLPPAAHDPFIPAAEIFVDGPNFHITQRYEGIAHRIDLNRLARRLTHGSRLVKLRYYTSPLPYPGTSSYRAQQRFFAQIARSSRIELVLGRHEPRTDPNTGRTYHVEKETDVNLAVDMVVGAYRDRYDTAILVAGDSDYVRAAEALRERGKELVWCPLPQQRRVDQLARLANRTIELDEKFLRTCAMPDR